jgi:hypothetical protein
MDRYEQLADAYEAVARANHYMVGIVEPCTADERDEAEQVLITRQNALPQHRGRAHKRLDLALDLIAHDRDVQRRAAGEES